MMSGGDPGTMLREIVRGERAWTDLALLGIEVELRSDGVSLVEPPGLPFIKVPARDLAFGLCIHRNEQSALRTWAAVVLGCLCFDWDLDESNPVDARLHEAIWDAAAGHGISESDWGVICAV